MPSLEELQERRAYECRLTPDRALETLDDAHAFLRDRGLLTRTPDSHLPSLYEAMHEEPYAPGRGGFADYPRTKWWWAGALAEKEDVYVLKIHRGKTLFLTDEVAALVDPICRAELERMEAADPAWARLLGHLADRGPLELGELQAELGLGPAELKNLRAPLERCGAVVSRVLVLATSSGGHVHTSELARWDQIWARKPAAEGGLDELVVAAVRAAVLAPEREVARWFSWSWRFPADLLDRLVEGGRLALPESGWVSLP